MSALKQYFTKGHAAALVALGAAASFSTLMDQRVSNANEILARQGKDKASIILGESDTVARNSSEGLRICDKYESIKSDTSLSKVDKDSMINDL